jgi:hypothetical protein
MLKIFAKPKAGFFLFSLLVLACSSCWAKERLNKTGPQNALEGVWDPTKYIDIDEIRPQMKAYCLTTYKGAEIEKFDLEVLSVIRNIEPGRDAILVQGTDERFIHSGPVWGCSGSPVYIDGRMAGALAFAYYFSKDPLYGVTPIKDVLRTGHQQDITHKSGTASTTRGVWVPAFGFDFSRPIDFTEINRQVTAGHPSAKNIQGGLTSLPCPLITSGLPAEVCEQLNASVEPFGLVAVPGVAGGGTSNSVKSIWQPDDVQLAPGASLAVPVVIGEAPLLAVPVRAEDGGHRFLRLRVGGPVEVACHEEPRQALDGHVLDGVALAFLAAADDGFEVAPGGKRRKAGFPEEALADVLRPRLPAGLVGVRLGEGGELLAALVLGLAGFLEEGRRPCRRSRNGGE